MGNFDDILHALTNADSLLPAVMHPSPDSTSDGAISDASRSSSKDEPTARQITARRRLYRENQKLGRGELRRQVVELSEELARRKPTRAAEKARLEASCPPAFFLWQSCALRQREEREPAEAEQRQLMAAINTQATYIGTLSSIAQKSLRVDCEGSSIRHKISSPNAEEAAYFDYSGQLRTLAGNICSVHHQ